VQRLRQHLKVSLKVQRILHGAKDIKSLHALPQETACDIIADMSVLLSFRKAQHHVRDAVYDVKNHDSAGLSAISSLTEFFDYVDWGLSSALDELETSELRLRKLVKMKSTEEALGELNRQDVDNKQMSCAALRYNQSMASPHEASFSTRTPMANVPQSAWRTGGLQKPNCPQVSDPYEAPRPVMTALHQTPAPSAVTSATPFSGTIPSLGGGRGFVYTPPQFLETKPQHHSAEAYPYQVQSDKYLDDMCN